MSRIERKTIINAPLQKIWDVLGDHMNYARWNIPVNEVSEIGPGQQFFKTNVGDFKNIEQERVAFKSMWSKQEGGPMTAIGYTFKPKGKAVEVTLWAEYEIEDLAPIMETAGEIMLKGAKAYLEYLAKGGDPKNFKKQ